MNTIKLADGIYMLTLNVENILFEEMWEIPKGVTLNSFIIKGEKIALVDGVCGWTGIPEELHKGLKELDLDINDIDHVIINHMEPDHSGWIEDFAKVKPNFTIHITKQGADLLKNMFGHEKDIHVVKAGDTLDLGAGRVLEFVPHPGVHWPDTMFTFDKQSGYLFSCDLFGTFGICEGNNIDRDFKAGDRDYFNEEEIRYYSNVLVTFNNQAEKGIDKARALGVKGICPGHGPVYLENVDTILDAYHEIAQFGKGVCRDEITILYGSMYGMTEKAVKRIVEIMEREGQKYHLLRLPHAPIGEILSKTLRSRAVIVAAPTYENKLFPAMAACLDELSRKKIVGKQALYVGSYGWAGGGEKEVMEIAERTKLNWNFIPAVTFSGSPKEEDYAKLEEAVMSLIQNKN